MFVFNVYLPCDKQDNEDEYLERLTKLHNIVSECDSSCISIVGDFNANDKTNANFAVLMKEFCEQFAYPQFLVLMGCAYVCGKKTRHDLTV